MNSKWPYFVGGALFLASLQTSIFFGVGLLLEILLPAFAQQALADTSNQPASLLHAALTGWCNLFFACLLVAILLVAWTLVIRGCRADPFYLTWPKYKEAGLTREEWELLRDINT